MSERVDAKVVVIGAGHGGGNVVAALRTAGHTGEIVLIGDEPIVPYHRPPLSKGYLKGTAAMESLKLRPDSYYASAGIALRLGARAVAIDRTAQTVRLAGGGSERYDLLVLATGSRARRLAIPGAALGGIHYLRSIADADAIRGAIGPGRRLAIVGGGYVGLEAAASALALGSSVVLLERESRILARVACAPLAAFFDDYHRAKGLEIRTEARVEGFEGRDGNVSALWLADGERLLCDAVIVGIGADVCDELAREAGIGCDHGGVIVDENACTSEPGVYAIGDMTWRPMPLYGGRMFRLESVPNALEQARRVAAHIMGKPAPAHEPPWFWSDQYDLKLQIVGVPFDSHRLVIRGDMAERSFAIFHLAPDNRVLAVEAVNRTPEFMAGRTLVGEARIVDPAHLADLSIPIKDLAK
ncbi:NAD(P)/FAD-dependent oxidoreductase [Sphingomonas sp. BAUL-RG-20F-R05-02]|uniref:NAD(P)/FAD-dependent oxidoreductase n=1 Tax=Sphingomonas sp. BAUL-RG-20F-R05-02 TaxID=2914830 RepID=UPI001F564115|nr:FAD-dependent oxidoreductase [Sphingomonas sp. BAUL-RG-20F-R05-02]